MGGFGRSTKMNSPPDELGIAIETYQRFWDSMKLEPNHPYAHIKFNGSIHDIGALAYCDYEWGHPTENYEYEASLLWSQVIVKNTEFNWGGEVNGIYKIVYYIEDYARCEFYPYIRFLEVSNSNYSQFDDFYDLVDILANHALASNFTLRDIRKLLKIDSNQDVERNEIIRKNAHTLYRLQMLSWLRRKAQREKQVVELQR